MDGHLISLANITMQFGAKPLFENISTKFGDGNRYGLIGANGSGKSTLMKILGGDLEPTAGNVAKEPNERLGKLRQDQFAYEEFSVIDTVIMGHEELWKVKAERCFQIQLLLDEPTNNLDINTIRWLEKILNERKSTMIIISHDRHFLNSVCSHMADLDYGELRTFPGNYDEYMTAATQARELMMNENAKKKAKIAELQAFVSRFSANASKARQATSRAKQLDKIQLEHVKLSSRVNPYIRFEQEKKLYRLALEVNGLEKGFDGEKLFENIDMMVEVGERIAIIGPNGIGKTTLLRCLQGDLESDSGTVKWSENANIGYCAQDHMHDFEGGEKLFDWMNQWRGEEDDEQEVRSVLGRLLFSKAESEKSVKVISGGEQGRMIFGRLMLQKPNILLMDEPTNHLDMESIESLNLALDHYEGTLIFVSHDREFVSSLATRIIELTPTGINFFSGTYDEYLASQAV